MAKTRATAVDRVLNALADPTRRGVLLRLMDEPGLSVSELARPWRETLESEDQIGPRSGGGKSA